jgi:hypothetical protein
MFGDVLHDGWWDRFGCSVFFLDHTLLKDFSTAGSFVEIRGR